MKATNLKWRASAAVLAIMLAASASTSWAQSGASGPAPRTIDVSGNGETRVPPDTADVDVAIETQGKTAAKAASSNSELATKVIDALKAKLGNKGKISTGGYSLNPEYANQNGTEKPTIVGYNALNSVTVHTGALDLVGPLIDAAIEAGANRVNSLNFSVKDDTKARDAAIASATRDARAQAEALAAALGVKLGNVIKATTTSEERPVPIRMRAMAMSINQPTPVEPGEVSVPASVTITFEIQ